MMELVLGHVRKPIRELRKSLKDLASNPPPKDVHNLRTRARRLEAISAALIPRDKEHTRQLLKSIKPLRKAAGVVRNMDVLAAKVLSLTRRGHDDAFDRLLVHLQTARVESAHELSDRFARERKQVSRCLKRFSKQIEDHFHNAHADAGEILELYDELCRWPAFSVENLHAFRLKIKQLRYLLQLANGANTEFGNALEKVKEQIGTWHDWQELHKIAGRVLDARKDQTALEKISEIERKKLKQALNAARVLKARFLGAHSGLSIAEP